ncbi:MAG: antitoxin Xre/MbcA/ParS toxin-binding domain-containing protein [Verrucomicrobiota bacterium]
MKYGEPTIFVRYLRESCQAENAGIQEELTTEDHPGAVIRRIREGLPMAEFAALGDWMQMSDEELAPLLGISRATFHRRKKAGHLEPPESEKLIRFARLITRATEVFEGEESAREWLRTPAVAFEGESPLSFADTEIGAREVEYLLGRLEHGVFS